MNKSRYIYILVRTPNYEGEYIEDYIVGASTDFKDIIEKINYKSDWINNNIYVMENGLLNGYVCQIQHETKDALEYFSKYTPVIFLEKQDEDEIAYVRKHLEVWQNKRNEYLIEKKNKQLEENQRKREEYDRKEYERLKKKFGE